MLLRIHIEDLAIIDRLTLDLERGFTVMTGETGAGKSIILGALNLVLGERASSDDVRSGCESALVEALFDLTGLNKLKERLAAWHLLDPAAPLEGDSDPNRSRSAPQLVVRREISAKGRSRCLVNGRLIPLSQLKEIGEDLVDLHGQHQHQSLLKVELHREILDAFGGEPLVRTLKPYEALYRRYRATISKIRALDRDDREVARQRGLLEYQANEINDLALEPGEDAALEAERLRLMHADLLLRSTAGANDILFEGEREPITAVELLSRCEALLSDGGEVDPTLQSLAQRLAANRTEIEDIAFTLRSYASDVEHNPARLEEVEDRLNGIARLKEKYGSTLEEILAERDRIEQELHTLTCSKEELERLTVECAQIEKDLVKAAEALTKKRRNVAAAFSKGLLEHLKVLNMAEARFEVRFDREKIDSPSKTTAIKNGNVREGAVKEGAVFSDGARYALNEKGADLVEFLISPNPGEDLKPLRKIASGGELSRIMLALKALMRSLDQVPTLVFDEIDTGISGRTGARIGQKMADLGQRYQVICITHLPQIAAQASVHFAVSKVRQRRRTLTRVTRLQSDERLAEIARLLGGPADSPTARRHARELLAQ